MTDEEAKFADVEFVIEPPKSKYKDDKSVPMTNNISKHANEIKNKQAMSPAIIMSNRNGVPPTTEQLQEIQNKIMGRAPNFSSLPREEKEKIMFDEIQNYHFSHMPSLEELQKENKKEMIVEVDSLNKADLVGVDKPHINIKSEQVRLEIASDGRTITFNNQEVLSQYREALKKEKYDISKEKSQMKKIEAAQSMHDERTFE